MRKTIISSPPREIEDVVADIADGRAKLSYSIYSQAHYYHATVTDNYYEEVGMRVAYYTEKGENDGVWSECFFRWQKLGDGDACKLHLFDDAWKMLPFLNGVMVDISRLSEKDDERKINHKVPNFEMIVEILEKHGFEDATRRTQ